MNILKPLLGMLFLSAIIGVIISVVKAIRDQQWYKNVQRRNPLKKPYGLGWLMDYAKSRNQPIMEEQKFDKVILFPGEFIAIDKAYRELGIIEHAEGLLYYGRDPEKGHFLWVQHRFSGRISQKYYYSQKETLIVDRSKPRGK